MIKDYENTNDYELITLYRENDEDAKNILFLKYKYIIDILIKKYNKVIKSCNIDYQEIYSECTVGFCDGLNSYLEDKNTTLVTYLTLCIDRRLRGVLRKYNTDKNKMLWETYSLDYCYDSFGRALIEMITDESSEPLENMAKDEEYNELVEEIKKSLSNSEEKVFELMLLGFNYLEIAKLTKTTSKQSSNTIQRIKNKTKKMLDEKGIKI